MKHTEKQIINIYATLLSDQPSMFTRADANIKKIRDMVTLITLKSNKFSSVKFSQQRQWAHLTSNFEHHKLI
jgi:hypothetical protein